MSSTPPEPLPPGLETLFTVSYDQETNSPTEALIIALHSSVIRTTNLRLKFSEDSPPTEVLPKNWFNLLGKEKDANVSARYVALPYVNVVTGERFTLVIQECAVPSILVVMVEKQGEKEKPGGKPTGTTLSIQEFVDIQKIESRDAKEVFKNIWELEGTVKDVLFPEEKDAREFKAVKNSDPYGSNLTEEQKRKIQYERDMKELERLRKEREDAKRSGGEFNPMMPERPRIPSMFPDPTRGLGSGDLDPFGMLGGVGGMLMDPRGFRRPQLPGGIPGARFDPIGPMGPGGFGGLGGGRAGGMPGRNPSLPFGMPNPDHERMPGGYDDMFS